MNDFCLYCTGNDKIEVIWCEDRKCVFYKHRRANLEWQENEKNVIFFQGVPVYYNNILPGGKE